MKKLIIQAILGFDIGYTFLVLLNASVMCFVGKGFDIVESAKEVGLFGPMPGTLVVFIYIVSKRRQERKQEFELNGNK